jgi:CBS domain-containing protein
LRCVKAFAGLRSILGNARSRQGRWPSFLCRRACPCSLVATKEAKMQAADVMTFGAASIRADAPVEEAARVMLQHRISGLPVVDDNRGLVGMVTEGDLLRREASAQRRRWLELVPSRP